MLGTGKPAVNSNNFEQFELSKTKSNNEFLDEVEILNGTRRKNFQNPFFAYYNINSLRFRFDDLKEILSNSLPDVLVLAETKLDKSFPNAQFFLNEYLLLILDERAQCLIFAYNYHISNLPCTIRYGP